MTQRVASTIMSLLDAVSRESAVPSRLPKVLHDLAGNAFNLRCCTAALLGALASFRCNWLALQGHGEVVSTPLPGIVSAVCNSQSPQFRSSGGHAVQSRIPGVVWSTAAVDPNPFLMRGGGGATGG